MKRLLCIAVAAVACLAISSVEVQAQQGRDVGAYGAGYDYGYGFGLGFKGHHGRGFWRPGLTHRIHERIEQPPYFALYPPVYYSNQIVRRPMGVSPFAAPPGIVPVEMMSAPKSARIQNPFFDKKRAVPVKDSKQTKKPSDT